MHPLRRICYNIISTVHCNVVTIFFWPESIYDAIVYTLTVWCCHPIFLQLFLIRCNCLRSRLAFRNINNKTIRQRCMTLGETPTLQSKCLCTVLLSSMYVYICCFVGRWRRCNVNIWSYYRCIFP